VISNLLCALAALSPAQDRTSWSVFGERVYTAAGEGIAGGGMEGGAVAVVDGKITAVAPGRPPEGSNRDDVLTAPVVTPGLIDASVRITLGQLSVEQHSERVPHMRVRDALNVFSQRWKQQAKGGVTAALVCAPDYDVIGGLASVVKTAGPEVLERRMLKADAVLRGAIGSQPSEGNRAGLPLDFFVRRPTTRMGVEWEARKAFYDAFYAQSDPERAFPGSDELAAVLSGELPFAVQAWTTQDIRTTVFLKEEIEREGMGHPRMFVDAAAEAWKEPQLLVRSGIGVVLPPMPPDGRTEDDAFMTMGAARVLHEAGVTVALSAHGADAAGGGLAREAGFAMRGGLSFDAALAAVTIHPARMLGVADRVGSIEVGKDADLVLWSGPPFEPSSRVLGVLVDGHLVVDPRPPQETN
jgi:imidazolonepropionase-like amidohydrolase